MRIVIFAFAAIVGITLPSVSGASMIVQSTFDTGAEGWEIGELFSSSGNTAPTWISSGGNPGGFIRTTDIFGVVAFQAPAAYLGNKSAAYGGSLHIEQRETQTDNLNYMMVLLSNGTLRLQFRTLPPAVGTTWSIYNIPLLASAGWEVSDGVDNAIPKPAATEAQLQSVLSNLTFFHLLADWNSGPDQTDLDNVRLESASVQGVPEPASIALLSLATLGGIGLRLRRNRMAQVVA